MSMKKQRQKLRKKIRSFGRIKGFIAIPLLLVGVLGLILPIIPGAIFLFIGIVLIAPSLEGKIKNRFGKYFGTN